MHLRAITTEDILGALQKYCYVRLYHWFCGTATMVKNFISQQAQHNLMDERRAKGAWIFIGASSKTSCFSEKMLGFQYQKFRNPWMMAAKLFLKWEQWRIFLCCGNNDGSFYVSCKALLSWLVNVSYFNLCALWWFGGCNLCWKIFSKRTQNDHETSKFSGKEVSSNCARKIRSYFYFTKRFAVIAQRSKFDLKKIRLVFTRCPPKSFSDLWSHPLFLFHLRPIDSV